MSKTFSIHTLGCKLNFSESSEIARRLQESGFSLSEQPDMMDQFGVYERLSCYDNLKVFADIYGTPNEKIMETLKLVGGVLQARILESVAMPSSRGSS